MKAPLLLAVVLPLTAADRPSSLGIFVDFSNAPAPGAVREMKQQVAALLNTSGMVLQWRTVQENRGAESFDQLVVVRFKGRCVARPGTPDLLDWDHVTLASTVVRDGHVLPYSEVDCDQVRRSLGEKVGWLGRALGVVVAHEVQHVLQNTIRHATTGWMKRALDWKDLAQK
jgi:hypothetical protein